MDRLAYEAAFASEHEVFNIGKLHLPSGKVVACDPYFCASAVPFLRRVSPGDYEVQLRWVNLREWGWRIAFAQLLVRTDQSAVVFEKAVAKITDSTGYFVDSGVGSFMDDLTRAKFAELLAQYYRTHPKGNYYTDVLAAEFKRNAVDPQDPDDIGKWNLHRLSGSSMNVAMFASGCGDGFYESYWGLNEDGDVISLVTDFRIL